MKPRISDPASFAGPGQALAFALALLSFVAPTAQAATNTWVGNTDANWNTAGNWGGGALAASATPVFGVAGTSGTTLNNDTAAGTSYAGITFSAAAGQFTIGGNDIILSGNISGGNPCTEVINFNIALNATPSISGTGSAITLGGVISGSFGITSSAAPLTLSGLNTYTGVTTVTSNTLVATKLDVGGNPSSIGQSSAAAASLVLSGGTFRYAGPSVSIDRSFTLSGNATLDASGSGAINWNNTATPAYGSANAARTLTLGGSNPGDNTLAALLTDNGTAKVTVTKSGCGIWTLSSANTYSGVTTINSGGLPTNGNPLAEYGILVATTLANGGSPSSIGQSSSAAANLLIAPGAVLKYTGPATSTDRAFTFQGDANDNQSAGLDASGTGAIQWTNTAALTYNTATKTRLLYLSGNSTANNSLAALINNNGTSATSLGKGGHGTWVLNGPVVNTYTGGTTVTGGTLVEDFGNMTSGYANLINSGSALTFGGGTLSLKGNNNNPTTQSFTANPTFSSQAGSGITLAGTGTGTMALTLTSTWTRPAGSTLNVTLGTGGTLSSSPAVDTSTPTHLVKGTGSVAFATVGGTDWAQVSGGTVVAFGVSDYISTLPGTASTSTANYSHSGSAAVTANETVNTLKINSTSGSSQSLAITSGQALTLNAGGLLYVGSDNYTITGGTLKGQGGSGEIVVHQFGSGSLTLSSALPTTTILTKTGPGTLMLTGANTFTGATYAGGGGTLVLGNQLALQSSPLTVNNCSVVFDSSVGANAFSLGGLSSPQPYVGPGYDIALQNNAGTPAAIALTVGNNNNSGTYYGSLSGPGSLIKVGSGTLTLSGVNSYTGTTTINGGTVSCGYALNDSFLGTPPGGPNVTVNSGGTLALNRNSITGTINLNGGTVSQGNGYGGSWGGSIILATATTGTLNASGGLTVPAVISGSGNLTLSTGTTTLTNANTYTGQTTIGNNTTLALSATGSIKQTSKIILTPGANASTLDVSAINPFMLSANTTLTAAGGAQPANLKGTLTTGIVNLGSQGVTLTYNGSNAALTVSQGTLVLNNNPFVVNTLSPLAAGTYNVVSQTTGTISLAGSLPGVSGTAIAAGKVGSLSVSGTTPSYLVLTISTPSLSTDGFPATETAGTPGTLTVTAKDGSGNTATAYAGTVHFTSSDAQAVLPANYTFVPADNGTHTFSVTLKTAGSQSITAADAASGASNTQSGITITPAGAVNLAVSGFPSAKTAGTADIVTVTAKDAYGNTATGYTGTVHFTSSDGAASLPADYTFTGFESGTQIFGVSLHTVSGPLVSITATDTVTSSITGTESGITVLPSASAATLLVGGFPASQTAGTPASVTVTAKNSGGGTVTGYTGTVHFTSTDPSATLPANYTFVSADSGTHTFTGVTLVTAGTQAITVTDTGTAITGMESGIGVAPAGAVTLVVGGYPSPQFVGTAGDVTVTAKDAYGNIATAYSGTVQFASSDASATLPPNFTFSFGDSGTHTFTGGVKFATAGSQSITAIDELTSSISGTQSGITVNLVPSTFTWANASSGLWGDAANWTNNASLLLPPSAGGAENYVLNFNTAGTYTATHNLNSGFEVNQVNFGGTVTIGGYSLALTTNTTSPTPTLPSINENSASGVTLNNNLVLAAETLLGGSGNGQVTLAGIVSGTGSLTKNSSGTLSLAGIVPNTYQGGTNVNTGTVFFASTGSGLVGTGPLTMNSGTTLQLNANSITNAVTLNSAKVINTNSFSANLNGPVSLSGSSSFDLGTTGNMSIGGAISDVIGLSGGITKLGAGYGPLTLNAVNTYTGNTVINAGTIALGSAGSIDNSAAVSIAAGATFDVSAKVTPYLWSPSTSLIAAGTGTTTTAARINGRSGGTVDMGTTALHLTFIPTSTSGDTTHPALLISQGGLTLNNNTFAITNGGAALNNGVYHIVQVGDGSTGVITETGSPASYPVSVIGSGLVSGCSATVSVSSGNVVLTVTSDSFTPWIETYFPTPGDPNAAKTADPDNDGQNNLTEFALDSNPTSGAASGKLRSQLENVGGDTAMVFTLPVRGGAVFSGSPALSSTVDGVVYTIEGTNDLATFDQVVTEVAPALSAGLPTLDTGWSYRSFRLAGAIGGATPRGPKGFLRASVAAAP